MPCVFISCKFIIYIEYLFFKEATFLENTKTIYKVSKPITFKYHNEPRREKPCIQGFRPGSTQTGLYSHIKWLKP